MKKLLLILLLVLLATGCTSKLMTLNDGVSNETSVTFGALPATEELVTADEETVITEELMGDRYIITATKGEKVETQEFTVNFETIDIDGTLPVDMDQFYSNPERLAKVSYVFSEDETTMTVTDENGEEPHSFNVPVNVIYPSYTIASDITIDTYVGYEISDFVEAEEGVEVASTLDEENSTLSITLSKNEWEATENVAVTLTSSEPQYPIKYLAYKQVDSAGYVYDLSDEGSYIIFDTESTGRIGNPLNNAHGVITYDNQYIYNGNDVLKYWIDGEYLNYIIVGAEMFGTYTLKLAN